MARPRKNSPKPNTQELSLVPVEEQPYPLPEGWKWVRLGDITQIVGGGTPSSKVKEYYEGGDIPWLSPVDLSDYTDIYISHGKKMITAEGLANSSARMMPAETVCLSSRAPIGYVAIAKNPLCTNQGFKSFLPSPLYLPRFLYWYLKGNKPLLESYASGTTFLELSGSKVAQIEFPLPPLDEQERIVTRIESLFAKLDEAKEKAEAVLDSYETRKAAILHKAFTGELTAKWREGKNISFDSWKEKKLGEVATLQTGLMKGRKLSGATVWKPYLRVANVQDGFFNLNEIKYIEVEEAQVARWTLQNDDVLFTEGGDFDKLGRGAVWKNQISDCLHQNHVFAVRVNKADLCPHFLSYQTGSKYGKAYFLSCSKQTTNLASINSNQLKNFPVRLPTLPEQQEITRILDSLLEKEQQSKEAAETVLEQIDLMKKAILAKAFRGELDK